MANDEAANKTIISNQQRLNNYRVASDDEINLAGIFKTLVYNKKIIIGTIFALTLLSALVAFSLPNIYRCETVLIPPGAEEIEPLFIPGIFKIDQNEVYEAFLKNLTRKGLRYQFFKKNNIFEALGENSDKDITDYDVYEKKFDSKIKIIFDETNKAKYTGTTTVRWEGEKNSSLVDWLNAYVSFVNEYTVKDIISAVQSQIKTHSKNINDKIETLRLVASQEQKDRIARLKEAIIIAKRLEIDQPAGSTFVVNKQQRESDQRKPVMLYSQDIPLYYRGHRALQGELEQLLTRKKGDDSFINGIRKLQGDLASLKQKTINEKKINAVRIDQKGRIINKPVGPKRKLIITLGGLLGLALSLCIVFVKSLLQHDYFNG